MAATDGKVAAKGQAGQCPTLEFELVVRESVEAMRDDLVFICRSTCASWAKASSEDPDIVATQVQGGITNLLYLLVNKGLKADENRSLLVRIFGKKTDLMIDRNRDNGVMRMLSDLDFGPPCHGFFANGRVEGFFETYRALKPNEMSHPRIMPLVAPELARMHSLGVTAHPNSKLIGAKSASLWDTIDSWLDKIKNDVDFGVGAGEGLGGGGGDGGGEGGGQGASGGVESEVAAKKEAEKKKTLELLDVDEMAREIAWLKSVLPARDGAAAAVEGAGAGTGTGTGTGTGAAAGTANAATTRAMAKATTAAVAFTDAVVFAHNDALAGNILYDEKADGGSGGVKLIDFEYGSWNFRGFDLANHFCEFAGFDCDYFRGFPSREVQQEFVTAYVGSDGSEFYSGDDEKVLFMDAVYGWLLLGVAWALVCAAAPFIPSPPHPLTPSPPLPLS